jgi:hypothetical protein
VSLSLLSSLSLSLSLSLSPSLSLSLWDSPASRSDGMQRRRVRERVGREKRRALLAVAWLLDRPAMLRRRVRERVGREKGEPSSLLFSPSSIFYPPFSLQSQSLSILQSLCRCVYLWDVLSSSLTIVLFPGHVAIGTGQTRQKELLQYPCRYWAVLATVRVGQVVHSCC